MPRSDKESKTMKRVKLSKKAKKEPETKTNSYFTSDKKNIEFVKSGCTTLDCIMGGGFALGRMVNIVGDSSTGKTGHGTEAIINFKKEYPDGYAAYRETEGAYDVDYAAAMGLPVDDVDFGDPDDPVATVEKFDRDLNAFLNKCIKDDVPGIYVLDSFDSLSDEAELKRDIAEGSYNMVKQKKIGEMFRKVNKKLERSRVVLIIISQVRENIGVSFGAKYRRSGGKALDFYSSTIFWLARVKTLTKTVNKVKRAYGITVRAKCSKSKLGFPFREATFDFLFGYGIDDVGACVSFLKEVNRLKDIGTSDDKKYLAEFNKLDDSGYRKAHKKLVKTTIKVWQEVEETFVPKRRKY